MKKLLSVLIAAIMIVSAVIPVVTVGAADGDMTITAASVRASIGDTVAVPVEVANNTGMAGLTMTIKYDTDALTLSSHENGTVFGPAPTVDKNFVWVETGGKNTTKNGTLVTLYFTVNEAAVEGQAYAIEVLVRQCSDATQAAVAVDAINGSVTIQPANSTILGASLVLGTDISFKYTVDLDPAHAGATMKISHHVSEENPAVEVEGVANDDGTYSYIFYGVSPSCLGCNIKAELVLDGNVLDAKKEYSVLEYCEWLLGADRLALGMSKAKKKAADTLVYDLLYYGAKSQIFADHHIDELVNANYEGKESAYDEEALTEEYFFDDMVYEPYAVNNTVTGVSLKGALVNFDYINSIYVIVQVDSFISGKETTYAVGVMDWNEADDIEDAELCKLYPYMDEDGNVLWEDASELTGIENTYLVKLDPITVTAYDSVYYLSLWAPKTKKGGAVRVSGLDYSVEYYVYRMQDKTEADEVTLTPMAELARATYNYGLAAVAYVKAK